MVLVGFMVLLRGLRTGLGCGASARRPPDPVGGHEQAAGAQPRAARRDGHVERRARPAAPAPLRAQALDGALQRVAPGDQRQQQRDERREREQDVSHRTGTFTFASYWSKSETRLLTVSRHVPAGASGAVSGT